jgi:hypothetical protein
MSTLPDPSADAIERNLGEQPIAALLRARGLNAQALVAASTEQITHKMVARACKGRRLTPNVQGKILRAFNAASGETHKLADLFNY